MTISIFLLLTECPSACQSDKCPGHYHKKMAARNKAPLHILMPASMDPKVNLKN